MGTALLTSGCFERSNTAQDVTKHTAAKAPPHGKPTELSDITFHRQLRPPPATLSGCRSQMRKQRHVEVTCPSHRTPKWQSLCHPVSGEWRRCGSWPGCVLALEDHFFHFHGQNGKRSGHLCHHQACGHSLSTTHSCTCCQQDELARHSPVPRQASVSAEGPGRPQTTDTGRPPFLLSTVRHAQKRPQTTGTHWLGTARHTPKFWNPNQRTEVWHWYCVEDSEFSVERQNYCLGPRRRQHGGCWAGVAESPGTPA